MSQEAIIQRPQPCACRFEWRPMPDFSGAPPKQLDECGFHSEQRKKLEAQRPEERRMSGSVATVLREVEKAVAKFPTWPTDPLHALAVLGEEYGELNKAVLQLTYEPHKTSAEDVRTEAIQTAAMALRFLQSLDTYQYQRGEQHAQGETA